MTAYCLGIEAYGKTGHLTKENYVGSRGWEWTGVLGVMGATGAALKILRLTGPGKYRRCFTGYCLDWGVGYPAPISKAGISFRDISSPRFYFSLLKPRPQEEAQPLKSGTGQYATGKNPVPDCSGRDRRSCKR